ncbi:B2MG protein, partial [Thinocorus orbignyianus]|nr:B2MG protein [Thinocorus orbignyianus]
LGRVTLLVLLAGLVAADEAPKVEVYARKRAVVGEENILNCFVSGFHPPKIDITLLKNGEPMSGVKYADMSFNEKWYFQRLVYVPFTPQKGDVYACRVVHSALPGPQVYQW